MDILKREIDMTADEIAHEKQCMINWFRDADLSEYPLSALRDAYDALTDSDDDAEA